MWIQSVWNSSGRTVFDFFSPNEIWWKKKKIQQKDIKAGFPNITPGLTSTSCLSCKLSFVISLKILPLNASQHGEYWHLEFQELNSQPWQYWCLPRLHGYVFVKEGPVILPAPSTSTSLSDGLHLAVSELNISAGKSEEIPLHLPMSSSIWFYFRSYWGQTPKCSPCGADPSRQRQRSPGTVRKFG